MEIAELNGALIVLFVHPSWHATILNVPRLVSRYRHPSFAALNVPRRKGMAKRDLILDSSATPFCNIETMRRQ